MRYNLTIKNEWRVTVNPMIGWQVHFGPSGTLHGYCTFSYNDQAAERANLIAKLPHLLGERNRLSEEVDNLKKALEILHTKLLVVHKPYNGSIHYEHIKELLK